MKVHEEIPGIPHKAEYIFSRKSRNCAFLCQMRLICVELLTKIVTLEMLIIVRGFT